MLRLRVFLLLLIGLLLAACDGQPEPEQPVEIEPGPGTSRHVDFHSVDGLELNATAYGRGSTAVIISQMRNEQRSNWSATAESLAKAGYLVFTYDYRGWGVQSQPGGGGRRNTANGVFDSKRLPQDLRGLINYIREETFAERVVLMGAAIGATVSAKVAAEEPVAGLVLISPPITTYELTVTDDELQALAMPKLFIGSADGPVRDSLQHILQVAPEPKEQHVYPGDAYGNDIFAAHRADLTGRILSFLRKHAPPD
jgi:pimeloyl-ACP methyl ester carboxylesterase